MSSENGVPLGDGCSNVSRGRSEREGSSGAGARRRGRSSRGRARSGGGVPDRRQVQPAGDRDRLARRRRRRRRRRRPGPGVGGLRTGVGPRQGRRSVGRRDRSHQRRRRVRGRRPRARARALRGRRAATGRLRRGGGVDEGLRRGQVVRAAEARRQLRAVVPDAPVERALERPEPLEGRGPVWKSTSELGYPEKYCVDLREPPRHRADVATGTMSRRWRGIATPSRRRSYGKHVASMAWGARNLISTQVQRRQRAAEARAVDAHALLHEPKQRSESVEGVRRRRQNEAVGF